MKISLKMMAASAVFLAPAVAAAQTEYMLLPESSLADTFVIQDFLDEDLAGGSLSDELARAYRERAGYEAGYDGPGYSGEGDHNWYDATAFYVKGYDAAQGGMPAPWEPRSIGVDVPAAHVAYKATLKRMQTYGAENPAACAQMQAYYDHYVEQLRETPHFLTAPTVMFTKWVQFYKACMGIQPIYGYPINHTHPHDEDAQIQGEPEKGRNERSKANALAASLGEDEATGVLDLVRAVVAVEGHTSTTASRRYNQRLSERRAAWMRELLIANGVSAARVETMGAGETELQVETADEVEEYWNRRTEISEQ